MTIELRIMTSRSIVMTATGYIGLWNSTNGKNTDMSVNTEKDKAMGLRKYGLKFITHTLKAGIHTKSIVINSITVGKIMSVGIIIQIIYGHFTEM